MNKADKKVNPISFRPRESTKEALDKACQKENRSIPYILERALRKELKLNN